MLRISHSKMMRNLPPLSWHYVLKKQLEQMHEALQNLKSDVIDNQKKHDNEIYEYEKDIYNLLQDNIYLHRKLNQLSSLNSYLHSEIESLKFQLSNCITMMNIRDEDENVICECCFAEVNKYDIIKCTLNHLLCKKCIDKTCEEKVNGLEEPTNKINCFCIHDCNGEISELDICRTTNGKKLSHEYMMKQFKEKLLQYINTYSKEEISKNIYFLKSDGSFRALQCPNCAYGPIMHSDCEDLETHHNQSVDRIHKISNKCPNCDYFSTTIHNFVNWNGHVS